jgi:hypothetical protein
MVYVVPITNRPRPKAQPTALLESLSNLLKTCATARGLQQREIATQIAELASNPILLAFARIHPHAKQVIGDAYLAVDFLQTRSTSHREGIIAAMNDIVLTQFDVAREGMPLLHKQFYRKQTEKFTRIDLPANLNYNPAISERPLSAWWVSDVRRSEAPKRAARKENFSEQVRVLKGLGFADEAVILMALRETAGNVSRAAKYLRRTGNHRA